MGGVAGLVILAGVVGGVVFSVRAPACDLVVRSDVLVVDGAGIGVGARVCLAGGTRGGIRFVNLRGSAVAPITIVAEGPDPVVIDGDTPVAVYLSNCEHVRLTGEDVPIEVVGSGWNGIRADECDYLEIDHVTVRDVPGIGILAKSVSSDQIETSVHDCVLERIGREGIYVGDSDFENSGAACRGVEVFGNQVTDVGWDGIQVCGAPEGVSVHHNMVDRVDLGENEGGNAGAGLIVDSHSSGEWYANRVTRARSCVYIHGRVDGLARVFNNVLVDCEDGVAWFGGEYSEIFNNTIVNVGAGVRGQSWMWEEFGSVHDNLLANAGLSFVGGARVYGNLVTSVEGAGFVDADGGNYRLRASSPAVDGGSGDGCDVDADGLVASGVRYVGAFEYSGVEATVMSPISPIVTPTFVPSPVETVVPGGEWFDVCPEDGVCPSPWPVQPTYTPAPLPTCRPTVTCVPNPSPTPYPTSTPYPVQP